MARQSIRRPIRVRIPHARGRRPRVYSFILVVHYDLAHLRRERTVAKNFYAFCDRSGRVPEIHLSATLLGVGYIAHECVHLAWHYLDARHSEETYAELIGQLTQAIANSLERIGLDVR